MPGLVRKLLIFATVEGLIIQAYGAGDAHKAICIDFETKRIKEPIQASELPSKSARLECHGVIGQISVASASFLITITKREQVAQIFGKSVYTITNIALLPLSSKSDADQAIQAAITQDLTHQDVSDSDASDSEDEQSESRGTEVAASPPEYDTPFKQQNSSSTSIAEDVATRTVNFGRYASNWLSKRGSVSTGNQQSSKDPQEDVTRDRSSQSAASTSSADITAEAGVEDAAAPTTAQTRPKVASANSNTALVLLPKILRSAKMILTSRSYFFSYDFDLTRRASTQEDRTPLPNLNSLNSLVGADTRVPPVIMLIREQYFWNRNMASGFIDSGHEAFLVPIIQGFVGQRTFALTTKGQRRASTVEVEVPPYNSEEVTTNTKQNSDDHTFLLTLISRRSKKRSGLRYLRRGIDDEGNCANFVETEQILSAPDWRSSERTRSFVQVRGSIPLYFSQSPYSFKPAAVFHNSPQANETAFRKHFQNLQREYGSVQIAMLVDKHGPELVTGQHFEKLYTKSKEQGKIDQTEFEWFDFHVECRGMKFENVQRLVDKLQKQLEHWGETVISEGQVQKVQKGILRTNCMDCLDRTNVAQSAFAQYRLQKDLESEGYDIDLVHDESTNWFNTLWADNGDAISRLYAGTAALKGDYTRTRKRNWRGAINDFGLTLTRYYSNIVNDYFSQAVIDLLLGNVSWRVFEDFESTMVSADPGISVQSAREAAVDNCAKIVIQNSNEDLIHGWTMLAPAHENTLRTLPFEEVIVLLTDMALYCCRLDWSTEKVARFEKVDLRSINKIRYGTYVTSTFTDKQMDEQLNQGILIIYSPGKGDLIRVNTRSLQNVVDSDHYSTSTIDGGTGILSWLAPGPSPSQERTVALKILPTPTDGTDAVSSINNTPSRLADSISHEIQRAITGVHDESGQGVEAGEIISAAEAKKRTGYLEQLGHSIKRFVWT